MFVSIINIPIVAILDTLERKKIDDHDDNMSDCIG